MKIYITPQTAAGILGSDQQTITAAADRLAAFEVPDEERGDRMLRIGALVDLGERLAADGAKLAANWSQEVTRILAGFPAGSAAEEIEMVGDAEITTPTMIAAERARMIDAGEIDTDDGDDDDADHDIPEFDAHAEPVSFAAYAMGVDEKTFQREARPYCTNGEDDDGNKCRVIRRLFLPCAVDALEIAGCKVATDWRERMGLASDYGDESDDDETESDDD